MQKPHDTELRVDPHLAQWVVRSLARIMATYAIGIGVQILIGGPRRFSGLSYQAALETPGAPWSWGAWALVAGFLALVGTLVGNVRLVAFGMFAIASWAAFFAISFTRAALRYGEANTTASWTYTIPVGVVCLVLAGAYYSMAPIVLRKVSSREAP